MQPPFVVARHPHLARTRDARCMIILDRRLLDAPLTLSLWSHYLPLSSPRHCLSRGGWGGASFRERQREREIAEAYVFNGPIVRTCGSVTRQRQHCVAGFFGLISREAFGDNGARRFLIVQGPRAPMLFWGCDGNTQALIGQFFFLSFFFFILQTTLEWSSLLCVSLCLGLAIVWRGIQDCCGGKTFFFF